MLQRTSLLPSWSLHVGLGLLFHLVIINSVSSYNLRDDVNDFDEFSVDLDLLDNHKLDDLSRRKDRLSANSRQGYADYDYRQITRRQSGYGNTGSYSGGGGGHSGGGYGQSSMGGVDVYSLLALGIFALFLGYVVFYYISVNGGGRSLNDGMTSDDMIDLMARVGDAFEKWAILDFIAKNPNEESLPEEDFHKKILKAL